MHNNTFIQKFMQYYNYPKDAVRVLTEAEQRLDAEASFGAAVDTLSERYKNGELDFHAALELLDGISEKYGMDERTLKFVFILNLTEWVREKYRQADIPDAVFWETFDDLRSKLLECMECEYTVGTFVPGWYADFLALKIFKYGRFEYQIGEYDLDFDFDTACGIHLTKGDRVLNLHIPSGGAPLTDEVRMDSYRKAYDALGHLFPDGRMIVKCGSWLLYPNHRKFLPKRSNILRFMDDFEFVCAEEKDSFYYDWRIFGHYSDLPLAEMPRDNSLRSAYLDWLLAGNKCGDAIGIFVFDGEKILRTLIKNEGVEMADKYFEHIVHGGDYNPDQWLSAKDIWNEDMRLMRLAHINNATVGIFSWTAIEPEEGVYRFEWLDEILDKLAANGIDVILATPSGARPAWLAEKYPEVLRVEENGIRNEYGVRHNHCLTSPVYREKVRNINRKLAERYKDHPAVKMWHISNEYSGECHCELCQAAFRDWLKNYYKNDLDLLNERWWNGFWSHTVTDWSQIHSPKERGESHVSALKLCWKRFVTDSHISFFENEIAPLRELTPDKPVTTNFMRMYSGMDYQRFAQHVDLISWDNYPYWEAEDNAYTAIETAFNHDVFRSLKDGKPFFMMESTPSVANWRPVNKIPAPGQLALTSVQAIAHGADSVQYFQWRKGRGGHEKFHGAVVDHCGHENTRVFQEVSALGQTLEKLDSVVGTRSEARIAVICDWENIWATRYFCGYNNLKRDYIGECIRWYAPFHKRGYNVDVIAMDADYAKYDLIAAPFLYMLKNGTEQRITDFVRNGGTFVATCLTGITDSDDRCFLGGFPANGLKDVFGIWNEETDSLPEGKNGKATFNGSVYDVEQMCDILHSRGAEVLGTYTSDFYAGMPSVTKNTFGKGTAYYVAFRNTGTLAEDVCAAVLQSTPIPNHIPFAIPEGISVRRRGDCIFVMNFTDTEANIRLDTPYLNIPDDTVRTGLVPVPARGFLILRAE